MDGLYVCFSLRVFELVRIRFGANGWFSENFYMYMYFLFEKKFYISIVQSGKRRISKIRIRLPIKFSPSVAILACFFIILYWHWYRSSPYLQTPLFSRIRPFCKMLYQNHVYKRGLPLIDQQIKLCSIFPTTLITILTHPKPSHSHNNTQPHLRSNSHDPTHHPSRNSRKSANSARRSLQSGINESMSWGCVVGVWRNASRANRFLDG